MAARAVIGMSSVKVPINTNTTAIRIPAETPDHRVRAPPEALIPVRDREPPAGIAWKKEPNRLARPWEVKSWDIFDLESSGLG
jgi:hypothetical protein